MEAATQTRMAEACGLLFGEDFSCSNDTLGYLAASGIRKAFRSRVKTCHPDLNPHLIKEQENPARDFCELKDACDFLLALKKGKAVFFEDQNTRGSVNDRYQGGLPRWPLRIGEYLYYSGKISWNELIDGIVRQKRNRPKIGELGVRQGTLDLRQVEKILSYCRSLKKVNIPDIRFGDAAVKLGLISSLELDRLVKQQRYLHPLGTCFITQGVLSRDELIRTLIEMNRHNSNFASSVKKS